MTTANKEKTIHWYGLKPDGSQCRCTDKQVMDFASDSKPMNLSLLWGQEALVLNDGTRLAKTKRAAKEQGWDDIAIAPFDV